MIGVNQEAKMSKVGPRPEEEERVPTDKKHVYDYVDAKI
jgi:lipopolysaccharide/colanic/teichoic acid biosynthesis glycosyltransferase